MSERRSSYAISSGGATYFARRASGSRHYSGPKNWAAIARKRAGKKFKEYVVYSTDLKGGSVTVMSAKFPDSHPWKFTVFARDVREACSYAARCAFAQSATTGGVRTAETRWWGQGGPDRAKALGLLREAPYLAAAQ